MVLPVNSGERLKTFVITGAQNISVVLDATARLPLNPVPDRFPTKFTALQCLVGVQ